MNICLNIYLLEVTKERLAYGDRSIIPVQTVIKHSVTTAGFASLEATKKITSWVGLLVRQAEQLPFQSHGSINLRTLIEVS